MTNDDPPTPSRLIVSEADASQRLDVFLSRQFPNFSRSHLRRVIEHGAVRVGGKQMKASYRLRVNDEVCVDAFEAPREGPQPEEIALEIIHEDEHLIVVNKPPAMVVHPAKGHWSGTLASALAFRFQKLSQIGGAARPGIVHRLDRDTSGVLVVAKDDQTHASLASQFADRSVRKEYFALTSGVPDRQRDMIDQPIGDHPRMRERKAIRAGHTSSREAKTFFEVVERFRGFAAICVKPRTGRTHQIRLHLKHIGCPVLCDRLYGGRAVLLESGLHKESADTPVLSRMALHAHRLTLLHPATRETLTFEAPIPEDIQTALAALRRWRAE